MNRFFKGQIDAGLFIPVLIGLIYAGTGGWSESRWTGALAIMGLGGAARAGFERGYATYNPELRQPPHRDEHGRFARKED
jgi:hypothetical protein